MKTSKLVYSILPLKALLLSCSFILFGCMEDGSTQAQQIVDGTTVSPPNDNNAKKIKIALLLDTSNSMDGLIDQAKSQLWQLVNELAKAECDNIKPTLQIALYEYGNNNLPMAEGYIRQVTPLTDDLDQISDDLFKLRTNGGEEYCGQVIKTSLDQLNWSRSSGDLQIIFIAGNEPFTQGRYHYSQACTNAKEKNIVVNTIFCGDFQQGINTYWKHGATLTGGSYMSIEQNRKTVFIDSPYDDKISELNSKLNKTYIGYGSKGKAKKEMQATQDNNAGSYGKANYVKRAVSKSSHFYKNKSWDLVDAAEEDEEIVNKLTEEQLPEEMKTMNNEQKQKFIADKKIEREKISKDIQALNKQRESFVAEKRKEISSDDMLDNAMLNAIKTQAKQKQFTF